MLEVVGFAYRHGDGRMGHYVLQTELRPTVAELARPAWQFSPTHLTEICPVLERLHRDDSNAEIHCCRQQSAFGMRSHNGVTDFDVVGFFCPHEVDKLLVSIG